jgi:hypothetical protein
MNSERKTITVKRFDVVILSFTGICVLLMLSGGADYPWSVLAIVGFLALVVVTPLLLGIMGYKLLKKKSVFWVVPIGLISGVVGAHFGAIVFALVAYVAVRTAANRTERDLTDSGGGTSSTL